MDVTRRSVLRAGAGSLAGGALAGCLSEPEDDPGPGGSVTGADGRTGYAAFFALWDWASQVGGDAFAFDNPVDVGTTGHGWSPDGNVVLEVAETDAFVYLDSPEFEWARRVAETLERDYEAVAVVDCLEGIELLEWDHRHGHEESDHGHEGDHDHDDDHEHETAAGEMDPHVWLDPVRAQRMVDTIAAALSSVDPDRADEYEANAASYTERLSALDDSFRELVESADRDVAVLAGHDSFTYLEDRYDFTLHTPVGVSPNDQPSHGELVETIELVDELGLEVILYDRFEDPTLAETIVEGSDAAEAIPITAAEGTTAAWREKGWGYVEQMEEINRSAFERALGSP